MMRIRTDNKYEVNSHIRVPPRHPRFRFSFFFPTGRAGFYSGIAFSIRGAESGLFQSLPLSFVQYQSSTRSPE